MTLKQFLLLLLVSAIWGSSFIFMKVLVPVFGPALTASFRLLSGAGFLLIIFALTNYKINWKKNYVIFIIIGITNSAIPFFLYSFAAQYIPASINVILNSTAPMFGAIFSYFIVKEKLSYQKIIGLMLGTVGVGIITSFTFASGSMQLILSVLACITAALLYGLSGVITKKYASNIEAKELAAGSMFFAGISLLPLMFVFPIVGEVTILITLELIVFGILCTSIAYLIYYSLIKQIGVVKVLTVTYLMPAFGILWSFIFLNESISLSTILGLTVILGGIYLISKKKSPFSSKKITM